MVEIESLSKQLGDALLQKGWTVTTAESCTGGGISQAITAIAGSSSYFNCAFVTYSNDAKQKLVDVQQTTLEKYGAVSQQTVDEMAQGALINAGAQVGISVSGIAGPGGGSESKPVGAVWIAVCIQYLLDGNAKTINNSQRFCFSGGREDVRLSAIKAALNMALICINEIK
ncbi:CinA family protein [Psychrosphaera aquimarina]|uniref:CinA family protein n=1 Tax=Psychrosphaera aquimarina TaxID=2044854 RepID=A0ABU3R314_9GAMM|nr:CinA family protein [Psychrosphaera aquimarina]MDU0114048.1 CinA family protein [Psychrosphaera aquimarina]